MPRKPAQLAVDDRPPPRKPSARSSAKAKRAAARLTAVQILYQAALTGQALPLALKEFADYRIGQIVDDVEIVPADREWLDAIIGAVEHHRARVEEIAGAALRGYTLDRLELLLRCVLVAGTAELLTRPDVGTGVIISDYLSITEAFYGRTEIKLINGALDAAARAVRTDPGSTLTDL